MHPRIISCSVESTLSTGKGLADIPAITYEKGYPFRYVALMMDHFNYPGLQGPNWTYGAVYLYHGNEP